MTFFDIIDVSIVGGYLLLTLVVGLYQSRKIKDMRDYAVAEKNYATPIMVATIFATWVGGESTLGMAEKVFNVGGIFILVFFGSFINKLIIGQFIAPRMGKFRDAISIGDMMEQYYGISGKIITGIAGTLLCIGTLGAQVSAIGYFFQFFLGISFVLGTLIGCGVVIVYSTFGGVRAVTITDVIQFIVLIVAFPMICNIALVSTGGYTSLFEKLPESHRILFPEGHNPLEYVGLILAFSIPFLDPAITQRLLMSKNPAQMATSMKIAALVEIPFYFMIGVMGLIAVTYYPTIEGTLVIPHLIHEMLPVGLKGLAIAGILAVIMSTADSVLNAASVTFVHDALKPICQKIGRPLSGQMELFIARTATVIFGSLSIIMALGFDSIVDIIVNSFTVWGPVVVIPLYGAIFGTRGTPAAFLISAASGLTCFGLWTLFELNQCWGFDALMPSMVANGIAFLISTRRSDSFFLKKTKTPILPFFKINPPIVKKKSHLAIKRILKICEEKTTSYDAPYVAVGVFSLINYVVPHFMWDFSLVDSSMFYFRFFAGILASGLLVKDYWPVAAQKYLPLYWYGVVAFCLPFLASYALFMNGGTIWWVVNLCLVMLVLAMIVDSISFIVLLIFGITAAFFVFIINHSFYFILSLDQLLPSIYVFFFSVGAGVLFGRRKEKINDARLDMYKAVAGSIAHEMRTPLATIRMGAETLKNKLPLYIDAYDTAVGAGISVPSVNHDGILKTIDRFGMVTNQASFIIDMLLMKLKNVPSEKQLISLSMKGCVEGAVDTYPLSPDQRAMISVECSHDFTFQGHGESFTYVVYNLLKNALYHLGRKAGGGTILIKTGMTKEAHILSITDTGPGIPSDQMPYIFDPFYSRTQHGTGLGLSFCRAVLTRFGGTIGCESVLGKSTTFILSFPKEQHGATIPQ